MLHTERARMCTGIAVSISVVRLNALLLVLSYSQWVGVRVGSFVARQSGP